MSRSASFLLNISPPDDFDDKAFQLRFHRFGGGDDLLEDDRLHPVGIIDIGDHRQAQDIHAGVPGDYDLGDGGHADGVCAAAAQPAGLSRGLQAGAGDAGIDAA